MGIKLVEWLMLQVIVAPLLMSSMNVFADPNWKEEGTGIIHIGGKVLCQDCTEGWNEWVNGAKPIKGCKVSITCLDERKRVVYYGSDETDIAGEFDLIVNRFINGKEIKPNNCFTRLVSSPDPVCNIATDFGGGRSGVKLGRPAVVYRDMIKHVLGPFYYTTPMCDEPDTTDDDDDDNSSGKETNY